MIALRPIHFVLLAALIAFGASLAAPFHFDDFSIFADPALTSPAGWLDLWEPLRTRPLTQLTFWLNYQLGGRNPLGYHAVNLCLHLLAVWLLYGVLARLIPEKAALIAVALFALHPIQAEPVAYVFARATLLATLFCLLSWSAWLDRRFWRAAGWFAFALLAKEECVTFPLFLLFFHRAYAPVAVMLGCSLAAGLRVLAALAGSPDGGAGAGAGITPLDYFSTQGLVIFRYLRLLALPYGFTVDPGVAVVSDWRSWLAWAGLAAIAICAWRKSPYGWWFAAGLILLTPSSSLLPAADLAADRRMYLPLLAFSAFAGLLLSWFPRKIVLAMASVLLLLSVARMFVWSSGQRLWSEAVERAPGKLRPRIQLARASDPETALRILEVAKGLAPGDPRPASEKGMRYLELGRSELALPEFGRALALAPNDPQALNNRGAALLALGQRDAAVEDFRRALRVKPCLADALTNLERLGLDSSEGCRARGGR